MPANCSRTLWLAAAAAALLALLMGASCASGARDHRRQTNLEAKVGSHVVFNCYIDFPFDSPIPYLVHWSKDVSSWPPFTYSWLWPTRTQFVNEIVEIINLSDTRRWSADSELRTPDSALTWEDRASPECLVSLNCVCWTLLVQRSMERDSHIH